MEVCGGMEYAAILWGIRGWMHGTLSTPSSNKKGMHVVPRVVDHWRPTLHGQVGTSRSVPSSEVLLQRTGRRDMSGALNHPPPGGIPGPPSKRHPPKRAYREALNPTYNPRSVMKVEQGRLQRRAVPSEWPEPYALPRSSGYHLRRNPPREYLHIPQSSRGGGATAVKLTCHADDAGKDEGP